MNNHHTFLLKNQDSDTSSSDDPYVLALSSQSIASSVTSTLSHSYTEVDRLAEIINRGGGKEYGGVIVTSGRAVDAWGNALKHFQEKSAHGKNRWDNTPFYVVGPRTQSQLLELRAQTPAELSKFLPLPDLILGAKEAGTGEALGRFIFTDYPSRCSSSLPLLYLIGDKNAGGVEGALEKTGIGLQTIQVYATAASKTFEQDFEIAMKEVEEGQPACVVFFAPSSAELALPTIRKHFAIRALLPTQPSQIDEKPYIKIVAIGPTTARALSEKHQIHVDIVSRKPEPHALAEAVVSLSSSS